MFVTLHDRLIARQPDAELERKKLRARRKAIWTQEDVDWAYRCADHWLTFFAGEQRQATAYLNSQF